MSADERKTAKWWAQINGGIAGDVGPFTCWTTKRGKTVFIKRAPPDKPPSQAQLKMRLRFRAAFLSWKSLDPETQAKWRQIVDYTGMCLSAHNLYMGLAMTPDPERLASVAADAGVEVEHPPCLPG